MTNRMQRDRRKDTVPWTWEPVLGVMVVYVFAALVIAQAARGIAYLVAGHGFRWPRAQTQVSSAFSVLAGNSTAGLPGRRIPTIDGGLLYGIVITLELVGLGLLTWACVAMFLRWGPSRMLGMATQTDAQNLLGAARLRRHATVIRPDLYGRDRDQNPESVVSGYTGDSDPVLNVVVESRPLRRALAVRLARWGRR